jgi:AcrR family transcriptional regulator
MDLAGRPLGPRALRTRQRILDATVGLLDEKPMRDLRVIDIARRIGSSPATFYQYFKDVEDVVLHLASEAAERTPEMVALIHGDWDGPQGHARARKLVELVIEHCEKYAPILRVRNNASEEGENEFRNVRMRTLMPIVDAFSEEIARAHRVAATASTSDDTADDPAGPASQDAPAGRPDPGEWPGGRVHPTAGAVAMTSVLERLAMYHVAIEELCGTREDLVETAATILQSVLTSRR